MAEPHPDGDDIACALESDVGRVSVFIRLPRIWWRIDGVEGEIRNWRDTPLAMTRQEFREHAEANGVIRIRLPNHLGSVKVGFDDEQDRSYHASEEMAAEKRNRTRSTSIPLEEFADYRQIDQRLNQDATLIAECGGEALPLIQISADPGVDDVTAAVTVAVRTGSHPGDTLAPRVACPRQRWRAGKGFSPRELRAAGVTEAEAKRRAIPVDRRRRSVHATNTDTLTRAIDD